MGWSMFFKNLNFSFSGTPAFRWALPLHTLVCHPPWYSMNFYLPLRCEVYLKVQLRFEHKQVAVEAVVEVASALAR